MEFNLFMCFHEQYGSELSGQEIRRQIWIRFFFFNLFIVFLLYYSYSITDYILRIRLLVSTESCSQQV